MSRPPLTMKGCLKTPMPPSPPGVAGGHTHTHTRKTVAFGEEICEEVYFADVWDRTPTEPARKLTYQDLIELKEIQRSLPRAQQLPDPVSGKPPSHFLNNVPIGLLPLLPESNSNSTSSSPATEPPMTPPALSWPRPAPPTPKHPPAPSTSWVPAHMQHLLPKKPPPEPKKPNFSFLPLLDTPTPSPYSSQSTSRSPSPDHEQHSDASQDQDPPTPSLTNASLESSPPSRASSSSPEPAFLSLADNEYAYAWSASPPLSPTTAWHAFPDRTNKLCPPSISPQRTDTHAHARRKNVMILNGIEISLDDDEDEDEASCPSMPSNPSSCPSSSPNPNSNPNSKSIPHTTTIPHPLPGPGASRRCSMSLRPPIHYAYPRDKTRSVGYADASPWAG